ncbi:MAG: hypothetical protein R3B06_29195 [Kofleriaceae bacterium]
MNTLSVPYRTVAAASAASTVNTAGRAVVRTRRWASAARARARVGAATSASGSSGWRMRPPIGTSAG